MTRIRRCARWLTSRATCSATPATMPRRGPPPRGKGRAPHDSSPRPRLWLQGRRPIEAGMGTATAAHHYATVNPYTGETVREFESLTRDAVDAAIVEAHDAFQRWRRRSIVERAALA